MAPFLPLALLLALQPGAAEGMPGLPPIPPRDGGHSFAGMPLPPSREQVAMRMMVRQLLLDRYDTNGDLELDSKERDRLLADAHAARKQQALAFIRRFDADGDGKLSAGERAAMNRAMAERRHAEEDEADTPPLPPPPHAAGREAHGHPRQARPHHPRMDKHGQTVAFMVQQLTMDAYDTDRDGHLDREESVRLREDGAKLYQAREAELLARYDTDGDGRLSEEELQAALPSLAPLPPPPPRPARRGAPHMQEGDNMAPPPPHHADRHSPPPQPQQHRKRGSINRLLDTHFDIDILINLAQPQG